MFDLACATGSPCLQVRREVRAPAFFANLQDFDIYYAGAGV